MKTLLKIFLLASITVSSFANSELVEQSSPDYVARKVGSCLVFIDYLGISPNKLLSAAVTSGVLDDEVSRHDYSYGRGFAYGQMMLLSDINGTSVSVEARRGYDNFNCDLVISSLTK